MKLKLNFRTKLDSIGNLEPYYFEMRKILIWVKMSIFCKITILPLRSENFPNLESMVNLIWNIKKNLWRWMEMSRMDFGGKRTRSWIEPNFDPVLPLAQHLSWSPIKPLSWHHYLLPKHPHFSLLHFLSTPPRNPSHP